MMDPIALPELAQPLLAWYNIHKRALPWRENPTPYRVWISEVMLQQTRVEAVRPYYARFLKALPDVRALAEVPDDGLMKLWEGLGYYRRARNLKKAAQLVVERYAGVFPQSYQELLTLPGIGDYTAGAIASIAGGERVPAVDGNVLRVLTRMTACEADISSASVKSAFRTSLLEVLPAEAPADFNQALMELGALICLPNAEPLCADCPVNSMCEAYQNGSPRAYPVKAARTPRRIEKRTVIVVRAFQQSLLFRRPDAGLLANMWEPLCVDGWIDEEQARSFLEERGVRVKTLSPLPSAKHIFSHVEWHMQGFLAEAEETPPIAGGVWITSQRIQEEHAIPGAYRAYRDALLGG